MRAEKLDKFRCGFSLIELIICVAIVAVLVGLSLPAIQKVRTTANRMTSQNNLHQMVLAAHNYAAEKGFFPPSAGWDNPKGSAVENGTVGSFFFQILPYTENNFIFPTTFCNYFEQFTNLQWNFPDGTPAVNISDQISVAKQNNMVPDPITYGQGIAAWTAAGQRWNAGVPAFRIMNFNGQSPSTIILNAGNTNGGPPLIKLYASPTDPSLSSQFLSQWSSYGSPLYASYLPNRELLQPRLPLAQITDGTSQTMMIAEGYALCYQFDGIVRYNVWAQRICEWTDSSNPYFFDGSSNSGGNWRYWSEADDRLVNMSIGNYSENAADFGRVPSAYYPYAIAPPIYNDPVLGWTASQLTTPTFQERPIAWDANTSFGNCSVSLPQSLTPGSIIVAMADGSVRNVSTSVSYSAWQAAITPKNGDFIDDTFGE